jgi:molybdopterin synthase catalytic subunit
MREDDICIMEQQPSEKKPKPVFKSGPIAASFIGDSIAKHQVKTQIGAHDIFLGQVRADLIEGRRVKAIEYSAYEEMAEQTFHQIREEAFSKWGLTCMHIYHSLGRVEAGEICLFVFVSSPHRQESFESCRWIVEEIKTRVPIFGKEVFEDDTHQWKTNR